MEFEGSVEIRGMRLSVQVEEGGYYTRPTIGRRLLVQKARPWVVPKVHEELLPKRALRGEKPSLRGGPSRHTEATKGPRVERLVCLLWPCVARPAKKNSAVGAMEGGPAVSRTPTPDVPSGAMGEGLRRRGEVRLTLFW